MSPVLIAIDQIVTLGTQIATSGAIRAAEYVADDVFEHVVAVAILIYEHNGR